MTRPPSAQGCSRPVACLDRVPDDLFRKCPKCGCNNWASRARCRECGAGLAEQEGAGK